jgi:drug/metabolite transporter (DMT)-like permease
MMRLTDNLRGALLMMASMAAFTSNDAFMKALLDDLPFFQTVFLRQLLTVALIFPLAHALGGLRLRFSGRDGRLVALRTLSEVGAACCFMTAIAHMPLANATAILQALPLTVALGAALFLGESVGWRRVVAIGIGLVGVLLIVQPGADGFNIYALWALAAVACVTVRDLLTRGLSADVPSIGVAVWAAAGVLVFAGFASLAEDWQPVALAEAGMLLAAAVLINAAYLFSIMVMRVGEIGFVAPFRYSGLLFALTIGVVVFGERPNAVMILGSLIVVATGCYMIGRTHRLRQSASVNARPAHRAAAAHRCYRQP